MSVQTINLALYMCALGATIIILMLSALSLRLKERIHLLFFLTVVCIFLSIIVDLAIELMMGHSGSIFSTMSQILDCIAYIIAGLQVIIFAWYLYEYLSIKANVSKKPFAILVGIGVFVTVMSLSAFFTDLYVMFDVYNKSVRQPIFWLAESSFIIGVFISMGIIIRYAKFMKVREWVSLMLCETSPLICYVIQLMIPGFYIALFGGSITIALIYVNIQVDLMQQMRLKEEELTEKRIAIMISQIQPHFLYNVLGTIDTLIYENQDVAHRAVMDFSKYLRSNMDSLSQKELIPFRKELEHTKQYLRLEELRFQNRLRIVYDIRTENFKLPVLTLRPIVENAVRYGVTKKQDGGTVTIQTEETSDSYCIMVSDDGVGFDIDQQFSKERSHNGIANVRNRIITMCGGSLVIKSKIGEGTKSIIEIPKQKSR